MPRIVNARVHGRRQIEQLEAARHPHRRVVRERPDNRRRHIDDQSREQAHQHVPQHHAEHGDQPVAEQVQRPTDHVGVGALEGVGGVTLLTRHGRDEQACPQRVADDEERDPEPDQQGQPVERATQDPDDGQHQQESPHRQHGTQAGGDQQRQHRRQHQPAPCAQGEVGRLAKAQALVHRELTSRHSRQCPAANRHHHEKDQAVADGEWLVVGPQGDWHAAQQVACPAVDIVHAQIDDAFHDAPELGRRVADRGLERSHGAHVVDELRRRQEGLELRVPQRFDIGGLFGSSLGRCPVNPVLAASQRQRLASVFPLVRLAFRPAAAIDVGLDRRAHLLVGGRLLVGCPLAHQPAGPEARLREAVPQPTRGHERHDHQQADQQVRRPQGDGHRPQHLLELEDLAEAHAVDEDALFGISHETTLPIKLPSEHRSPARSTALGWSSASSQPGIRPSRQAPAEREVFRPVLRCRSYPIGPLAVTRWHRVLACSPTRQPPPGVPNWSPGHASRMLCPGTAEATRCCSCSVA